MIRVPPAKRKTGGQRVAKKQKAKAKTKARRGAKRAAVKERKAVKARKAARKPARASRPAARKTKKRAAAKAAPAGRPPARSSGRKPASRASAGPEMVGEGNWKANEQYRERLRKFSKTHDVEALAREAARVPEPDPRDSKDEIAESARRGAEEEPEW